MAEIFLCSQPTNGNHLASQCGISSNDIMGLGHGPNFDMLRSYTPYLIGDTYTDLDRNLLSQIGTGPAAQNLTNMCLSYGEDNTLALAEITVKLQESGIAMMGASTSVYGNRVQGFGLAVQKYQVALLAYRDAMKGNPATRVLAKEKAFTAFKEMQTKFRHEVTSITSGIKAHKGTVLGNPTRGTNIARSSRTVAKLNITSKVQASQLVRYGKYTKFLGNGLAVIDFGSRVGNIHNSYKAGGNWERDMFIESSSFAVSAGAGLATLKVGGAALGILVAATPLVGRLNCRRFSCSRFCSSRISRC